MSLETSNLPAVMYKFPKEVARVKRVASPRQLKWRARASWLWRLRGMVVYSKFADYEGVLTPIEQIKLKEAQELINDVVKNFTKRSRNLGFNAHERCWCGRVGIDVHRGSIVCKIHKDII